LLPANPWGWVARRLQSRHLMWWTSRCCRSHRRRFSGSICLAAKIEKLPDRFQPLYGRFHQDGGVEGLARVTVTMPGHPWPRDRALLLKNFGSHRGKGMAGRGARRMIAASEVAQIVWRHWTFLFSAAAKFFKKGTSASKPHTKNHYGR